MTKDDPGAAAEVKTTSPRALIADDDEMMRLLIDAITTESGYEVEVAENGALAWAAYQRARPTLLILDWQMPGMDGLEVCRRVREADPSRSTFVLMITARDTDTDLARVLDSGVDDYLSKPLGADALRARLAIAERRIALETKRREAEEELARARWLAGIGETTIALQHEINNPLAALLGSVSLLDMSNAMERLSPEDRESLDVITKQARRIAEVVKRLSKLKNPRSVEYLRGSKMIDLSPGAAPEGEQK
jgi:sigma-B regulation protein RsbU (phosphoserine phosphatase)